MIRRLKKRLVIILMLLLSGLFVFILLSLNIANYQSNMRQNKRLLSRMVKELGVKAFCENPESNPRLKDLTYCTIKYTGKSSSDCKIIANSLDAYSTEQLLRYAEKAMKSPYKRGTIHSLVYRRTTYDRQPVIILMDNFYAVENSADMFVFSIVLIVPGLIVFYFLSLCMSRWLIAPVEIAFQTQRQFISDASHELKTPLTVIRANADLLDEEVGDNPHLQYIHSETDRMNHLISQMLTLARMDNPALETNVEQISFTDAVMSITLPFESVAYENNLRLEFDIEENLIITGTKEQIQQLVSILLDNAIKHCFSGGLVMVRAFRQHKKIHLCISNNGEPIPPELQNKIFQRFYRTEESRNNQERYGLGLSIAQAIVKLHRGKISVSCKDGLTTFHVILPVGI